MSYKGEMTVADLRWCRSHDWGKDATLRDGIIYDLTDEAVDMDGNVFRKTDCSFGSRKALRDWAGY